MKNISVYKSQERVFLFAVIALLAAFAGCSETADSGKASQATKTGLPKLDFHKPESLTDAVGRLREIHDDLVGEEPLPAAREFKVLEIIHGKGANAHSHYYLANSKQQETGEDDHLEDDHHGMHSEEKIHQVEVDVFTEFQDIVNWLPKIAAASDGVEEETWSAVKQYANDLGSVLGKTDPSDTENSRTAFRANSKSLRELIKKLEAAIGTGKAQVGA